MRGFLSRLADRLLTRWALAVLADGTTPGIIRDGQGAGPFLSDWLAGRMEQVGGWS